MGRMVSSLTIRTTQSVQYSFVNEFSPLLQRQCARSIDLRAIPESSCPCQDGTELLAQVLRSTLNDHLADRFPFVECA